MIEVIYNNDGTIKAVCEYLILNKDKCLVKHGETMFIGSLEIIPQCRGNGIVRKIIKNILTKHPEAERCFFYRRAKYPGKKPSLYKREQFEKF